MSLSSFHIDATAMTGILMLGIVACVAIAHGSGEVVAGAAVGAIGGFLVRGGSSRTTTTTHDDPHVSTRTETDR